MGVDPGIPEERLLFEPVEDGYGTRLALVFGNEALEGVCPFYGKQCYHCDIGAGEGVQFNTAMNARRLAFFREHYATVLPRVVHLVLYNSGSVLNPREFSGPSLQAILEWAAELPQCLVVSLDSREAYMTAGRLDFVLGLLRPDQQARPILGLETQDDAARMLVLNKKMSRGRVETVFRTAGRYQESSRQGREGRKGGEETVLQTPDWNPGRVGMDINIVFGTPPFQGHQAMVEAGETVGFVLEIAGRHDVPVDFNLHPYYPSRIGLERFPGHPRARLDAVLEAAERMREMVGQRGLGSKVFIGCQDEAHDQEPGRRTAEFSRHRERIARFNADRGWGGGKAEG